MANITRRMQGERNVPTRGAGWPFDMFRQLMWDPFEAMVPGSIQERGIFTPAFEVKETDDAYLFMADLPGVKEEDLDLSLSGNRLTVSGKREEEARHEGENVYAYERSYGTFTRSFTLPEDVDPNEVSADLKDGVLAIRIGKKAEVQPKKIQLKGLAEKVKGALGGKEKSGSAKA